MKYIFDLDNTLYSKETGPVYNKSLVKYLKNLRGQKIIFSNNTTYRGNQILKTMRIKSLFSKCIFLGGKKIKKPRKESFLYASKIFKLNKNDNVIFFDDRLENRKIAAQFGWKAFKPKKSWFL